MLELIKTPTTVIHVMACLFLVLVILIQPGRTGGLSGALGGAGATQIFGGRGAGNLLSRVSWTTATIFFLTSVTLAYLSSSKDESLESRAKAAQSQKPDAVTPAPASSK